MGTVTIILDHLLIQFRLLNPSFGSRIPSWHEGLALSFWIIPFDAHEHGELGISSLLSCHVLQGKVRVTILCKFIPSAPGLPRILWDHPKFTLLAGIVNLHKAWEMLRMGSLVVAVVINSLKFGLLLFCLRAGL